jgi:hypothetical protein
VCWPSVVVALVVHQYQTTLVLKRANHYRLLPAQNCGAMPTSFLDLFSLSVPISYVQYSLLDSTERYPCNAMNLRACVLQRTDLSVRRQLLRRHRQRRDHELREENFFL